MGKAHIKRWRGKWFVAEVGTEYVGACFASFRAACDHASYLTLRERKRTWA